MKIPFILLLFLFFTSEIFPLPKKELSLGKGHLFVEIADTPKTRSQGLMGRGELSDQEGMLFIYPYPEKLSFWMKNTSIPLSIAFFNAEKKVIALLDMEPPLPEATSFQIYESPSPALYALEVPKGWFERHGVSPGMKFTFLDQGDLLK